MIEYKNLLRETGKYLKSFLFIKKGTYFIRENEDFYQIIDFQKDRYINSDKVSFTINVGITSKLILKHRGKIFQNNLINNQCQIRLENLTGNSKLSWIEIEKGDDIEKLLMELIETFESFVFDFLNTKSNYIELFNYLFSLVEDNPKLVFYKVEDFLILTKYKFPDKLSNVISMLDKKAMSNNDKLFLNEVFYELSIII